MNQEDEAILHAIAAKVLGIQVPILKALKAAYGLGIAREALGEAQEARPAQPKAD